MPDQDKPCCCPRCGWLGTIHDSHEFRPSDELAPLDVCPRCSPEVEVQTLGQHGLDKLREEYRLLLKPGFQSPPEGRQARREKLERFFEHIGQSLKTA